jgi:ABC-2 type transport system ATP-binding protein
MAYHYIKAFLIFDFINNNRRRRKNGNKLAGNLRAVAQGDERDVENKEQGCWRIRDANILPQADYLCERVGIMDRRKIIALDTPTNLKDLIGLDLVSLGMNTGSYNVEVFKKLDFVTEFRKYDDFVTLRMERGDLRIPAIMEVAKLAGIEIKSVNLRKPSLEDVFLHFTGRRIRE